MTSKIKKISKRLLSITLCIVMLATTFFIFDPLTIKVYAATGTTTINGVSCTWNDAAWSGTRQTSQPADFKVSGNNYYIGSAAALSYFEYTITDNGNTYAGKNVYLVCDINLNNKAWTSIGDTGGRTFQGVFDGRGCSIIGLNVTATDNDRGFFRKFTANTTIKNVKFKNAKVCSSSNYGGCSHGVVVGWVQGSNITLDGVEVYDSAVYGSCFVGGLAGAVEAGITVKNCKFQWTGTGNLQNSAAIVATNGRDGNNSYTGGIVGKLQAGGSESAPLLFQNCSTIAKLTASSGGGIGGIVGMHIQDNYVKFDRCTSRCNLETNKVYTAGIIGYEQGFITLIDCTSYGDGAGYTNAKIVAESHSGGLVGEVQDDICSFTRCYNYMNITGSSECLGGFLGKIAGGRRIYFTNCENYGSIQTTNQIAGGIVGYFDNNEQLVFTDCKNTGNIRATKHAGGFVGACQGYVNANRCVNSGNATTTAYEHAAGFAAYIADDGCSFTDCTNNGNITVPSGMNCVGGFVSGTGTSVGGANWTFTRCTNNGKITGSAAVAGFFGYLGNDDRDPNTFFTDCVNNGEILGYGAEIGGLMANFDSDGKLKFERCKNTGYVHFSGTSSTQLAGGMVGISKGNEDEFVDCINTGTISSNSTNNAQGNATVGGMIGYKWENNYMTLTHCYNTGSLTAFYAVGGLVGDTSGGASATDCYNLGNLSVKTASYGHIGGIGGLIRSGLNATKCFNGNGKKGTIASYSVSAHDAGGLSGYVGGGATLTNCYNNAKIYANTTGSNYAGGLIGEADGTINALYCYNAGAILGANMHTISAKNPPAVLTVCYYLSGTGPTNGMLKTDAELKSANMISLLPSYIQDVAGRNTYYPIFYYYKEDFHVIDVAGYLDGQESDGISGFGKADVYINGTRVAQGCTDYNDVHPVGTRYEIKNIATNSSQIIYRGNKVDSNGWHNGLTGTVAKTSPDVMGTRLDFITNYTISYTLNGGSITNPTSYNYETSTFTLNNPTKTGYAFSGWTGSNGSTPETAVTISQGSTGNKSYTANWTPITYAVVYNGNGNTGGVMNSSIHTYDEAKELTVNGFRKTGYDFVGWATSADGEVAYADSASVINLASTSNAKINLYAKWTQINYTVVYNGNGNTGGVMNSSIHTYSVAKELTANEYTKTGYTFAGWATSANGAVAYADGASVINLSTINGATIILNAKWTKDRYTITYTLNGGSAANKTTYYVDTSAFTLNNPIKTGYTFAGWSGTEIDGTSMSVTIEQGSTGYRNYTANWTPTPYTITYNLNGGTATNPTSYNIESEGFALMIPVKSNAVFEGWKIVSADNETGLNVGSIVTDLALGNGMVGNISLEAQWHMHSFVNGACDCGLILYSLEKGAVIDNGLIYGLKANMSENSFAEYLKVADGYSLEIIETQNGFGTGTNLNIKNAYNETVYTLNAIVFGDVNGDGWYDGADAIIVSCIANEMLMFDQIIDAVWLAADCNFDGVIDNLDVQLLEQAGIMLASVDQTMSTDELVETSSYQEYIQLIDQNPNTPEIENSVPTEQIFEQPDQSVFSKVIEYIFNIFKWIWKIFK